MAIRGAPDEVFGLLWGLQEDPMSASAAEIVGIRKPVGELNARTFTVSLLK